MSQVVQNFVEGVRERKRERLNGPQISMLKMNWKQCYPLPPTHLQGFCWNTVSQISVENIFGITWKTIDQQTGVFYWITCRNWRTRLTDEANTWRKGFDRNMCMGYSGRISAGYLEAVFSKIDLFAWGSEKVNGTNWHFWEDCDYVLQKKSS